MHSSKKNTKIIEIRPKNYTNSLYSKLSDINNLDYRLISTDVVETQNQSFGDINLDAEIEKGFISFILLAVTMGFLALLTPCVFPMIPITVSFFTHQGESPFFFSDMCGERGFNGQRRTVVEPDHTDRQIFNRIGFVIPIRPGTGRLSWFVTHIGIRAADGADWLR